MLRLQTPVFPEFQNFNSSSMIAFGTQMLMTVSCTTEVCWKAFAKYRLKGELPLLCVPEDYSNFSWHANKSTKPTESWALLWRTQFPCPSEEPWVQPEHRKFALLPFLLESSWGEWLSHRGKEAELDGENEKQLYSRIWQRWKDQQLEICQFLFTLLCICWLYSFTVLTE